MESKATQLYYDIIRATITLEEGEPKFFSAEDIERLTASASIEPVLREVGHEDLMARIHNANCPAKKIFLILARAGRLDIIKRALSGDFSDHDLPISIPPVGDVATMERAQHPSSPDNSISKRSKLEYFELDRFREYQGIFLSPIFDGNVNFSLKSGVPLPLVRKYEGIESGFSIVYRVEVHPSHIPNGPTGDLAMKQLGLETKDRRECLKKEMKNLESVRELSDPHLIRPIAACTRGKQAFIFFPWAEGGNLLNFWQATPPNSQTHIGWMLRQMVGLSQALGLLASKNCRHSDVKPQNILHFPNGTAAGTLMLTDLGISKFNVLATTNRWGPTTAKSVTVRYSPPEFDELNPERVKDYLTERVEDSTNAPSKDRLSRRFDIWSLGCVFFEFLIWAGLGQEDFIDFNQSMDTVGRYWRRKTSRRNTTDSPDSSKYLLHETVIDWFKKLKKALRQTPDGPLLREVLELVEEHMLIIDSNGRYKASEVHHRLEKILQAYRKLPSPLFAPAKALSLTGE